MSKFPILAHFAFAHLPPALGEVSKPFHDLAHELALSLKPGAELSTALRKLLESKDAAVRAAIDSGALEQPFARLVAESVARDPITGNPLPAGSPYSAAHEPDWLTAVSFDDGVLRTAQAEHDYNRSR